MGIKALQLLIYKERGWKEFHIIPGKKRIKLNLNEEDVRKLGKKKFRDNLIKEDLRFLYKI